MKSTLRKVSIGILIILSGFLALTGFLGGVGLLAKINAPPVEQLSGSMFSDFTIPGLALFILVGGSALLATILLVRKNKFAVLFAMVSAIIIMTFEFVEVLVIGSPAGVARTLQIFYFSLGIAISSAASTIWFNDLVVTQQSTG